MLHRIALLLIVASSLLVITSSPGCAREHAATSAHALTIGTGPACAAFAACLCSTCSAECADVCADPAATQIEGPYCKACVVKSDPVGCKSEYDACVVETAPVFPALDCVTDNPDAPACVVGFVPASACVDALDTTCIDAVEMRCPAGLWSGVCCVSGEAYTHWTCVVPSVGAGGAGGAS